VSTSNYKGPAREFSEGNPDFDLMLTRGFDFLDYMMVWGGYGGLSQEERDKMGQQERLGLARSMAIALEKNPKVERTYGG
jgi:hypothetical protein